MREWLNLFEQDHAEIEIFPEIERHSDEETPFAVVAHDPTNVNKEKPLVIVVHPGDMVERARDWDDRKQGRKAADFSIENQIGTAQDIREWRAKGAEVVVLHRESCVEFDGLGGDTSDDLVWELEDLHTSEHILFGDDLDQAASWIIQHLHVADRPHVFLCGAYSSPNDGCLTFIGQKIEQVIPEDRISVSIHSPPGNSPGKVWRPGNRTLHMYRASDWRNSPAKKP